MFQILGGESYVSGVKVNSKTSRFVQDSSLQVKWSMMLRPFINLYMTFQELLIQWRLLFNRCKGHGSGCTTALCGMHRYLYRVRVYCLTRPPPCAVTIRKTCTDQWWTGYRSSVASKTKVNVLALWSQPVGQEETSRFVQDSSQQSSNDWRCCGLFSTCIWTFKNYLFTRYYVWLNNQLHFINTNLPSSPIPGQLKSSPSEQSTTHSLFWTHRSDPVGSHTPGWDKFSSVSGTPPIKVQTTVYYKLCAIKWEDWGT